MRRHVLLVFGLGLAIMSAPAHAAIGALPTATSPQPIVKVGYWCSPGYEASYGRCVATAATDQVDLYLNEPGGYIKDDAPPSSPRAHRRHRRHGIAERY